MRYFDQYRRAFGQFKSDTVHVSVMRDSAGITKLLTLPVRVSDDGLIGVELTPPDRLLSLSTVSYTHLDVYKRQAQNASRHGPSGLAATRPPKAKA